MTWTHFGVLILLLAWSAGGSGAHDRKVYRRTILNRTSPQGVILNTTEQSSQQIVAKGNGDGDDIASSTGYGSIRTPHLTRHHGYIQGDQRSNSTRGGTGQIRNLIQGRKRTPPETATSLSSTPQENSKPNSPTRTLSGSLSSLNVLASFAGKNRVLVISAPHNSNGYYRLMMNLLKADVHCEMAERHMQQITMFHREGEMGGRVSHINSRGQVLEQPLDPAVIPRLMNFLKLEEGKFGMVLLKKNLRVEERYPYPVRLEAMYEAIDQTHMRKLEKTRQRGFVQRCKAASVEGQVIESEGLVATGLNTRVNVTVQRVPMRKGMERRAQVPKQTTKVVAATISTTTTGNATTKRPTTTTKPTTVTKPTATTKPTARTKPTTTKPTARTKPTTTKPTARTKPTATTKPTARTKPTTTTKPAARTKPTTTTKPTARTKPATTAKVRTTPTRKTAATTIFSTATTNPTITIPTTSFPRKTSHWNLVLPTTGEPPYVLSINRNRRIDQLTTKSTSHPIIESHDLTESIGGYKNQYEHTTGPKHKQPNGTSATQLTHENKEDLGDDHTHKIEVSSFKKSNVTSHNAEREEKKTDTAAKRNKADKKRTKAAQDGDGNIRGRKPGKKGVMFQEKDGGVKLAAKQPIMGPLASFFSAFDRRRRLLVITAPSVENRMYTQQRDEYLEQVCEMAIRKISIIVIFGTWSNGTMKIDHYQLEQDQPLKGVPNEDLTNQPLIKALRKELGMTFNDYYMVLTDFDMKVKQEYEVPIAMKAVFDYIDTFSSRIKEMEQQKKQGLTCKREDKTRSLENFLSRFRWRRRLFVISAPEDEEWTYQQQLYALTSQACNLGLRHMSVLKLVGKNMDAMGGVLELYPINGSATVEREDLSASLVKDIRNYFQISPEYFSMLLVGKDGNVKSWYPSPMWSMSIIYDLVDSMQLRRQEMAIQQSLGMRCPEDEYGHHSYHESDRDGYQHRGYGY